MGVYIKGMEIPANCRECPCFYPEYNECNAIVGRMVDGKGTPPTDCPLIPVPPHGDLVDRNALSVAVLNSGYWDNADEDVAWELVQDAPAIISAEEGK